MIEVAGDTARVSGPVTIANVNAVLDEGRRALTASALTVDLSGVTEVDSTCVSLLLEWRRQAQRAQRKIRYTNLPHNLKSLMALYGVGGLFYSQLARRWLGRGARWGRGHPRRSHRLAFTQMRQPLFQRWSHSLRTQTCW